MPDAPGRPQYTNADRKKKILLVITLYTGQKGCHRHKVLIIKDGSKRSCPFSDTQVFGNGQSLKKGLQGMTYALYSCQDLILMSSSSMEVKAWIKALARRVLVIKGILWSMAARRMR